MPSSSSSAPSPSSSQAGYASTSNYSTSSTVSTPSSGTRTPQKVETVPDELFGDAPSLPFTPHSPIIGPNVSTSTKYNSTPSKNAHTPTRFGTHTRLSSTSNPLAIPSSASPASPPFSTSSQPPSSALNPSLPSPQSSMAPPAATPALSPSPASPLPDTSLTSRVCLTLLLNVVAYVFFFLDWHSRGGQQGAHGGEGAPAYATRPPFSTSPISPISPSLLLILYLTLIHDLLLAASAFGTDPPAPNDR